VTTLAIVGANVAGISCADAARKAGYDGRVVVIGAEPHLPYDRPPLSKQLLAGGWDRDRIALRQPGHYADAGIELNLGRTVTALDLAAGTLAIDDGQRLPFDYLVAASGVRPVSLPFGTKLENVHQLRTLDDCERLRAAIVRDGPLAIIGAGFVGTEVAAAARQLGTEVTVIDPLAEPLGRALGNWMGSQVRRLHLRHGVRFCLGVGVAGFIAAGSRAVGIRLADGTRIDVGSVLVAVGSTPNIEWLAGSGLASSAGVLCDQYCLAAPNVAAAGDVASWYHPGLGRLLRVEHRMNAQEHGTAAAVNLLSAPGARAPFAPVPYFWSDQFDVRLQAYGITPADATVNLATGDVEAGKFTVTYRQHGRLVGAAGWNSPREMRSYRALVAEGSRDATGERPLPAV
jgi:3-phenylpropionate/trans-cinnamate dioxygenase ferredoxin reductase component